MPVLRSQKNKHSSTTGSTMSAVSATNARPQRPTSTTSSTNNSDTDSDTDSSTTSEEHDTPLIRTPTLDQLQKMLRAASSYYMCSDYRTELAEYFKAHTSTFKTIKRVIVVGLGTSADHGGSHAVYRNRLRRYLLQLVCTIDMARLLSRDRDTADQVEVFAQDPELRAEDRQLMRQQGVVALEDDSAFERVDAHTLVFAPFFPRSEYPEVFTQGQFELGGLGMAVFIGNPVEYARGDFWDQRTEELQHNVRSRGYQKLLFPTFFEVRREEEEDEEQWCRHKDSIWNDAFDGLEIYTRQDL